MPSGHKVGGRIMLRFLIKLPFRIIAAPVWLVLAAVNIVLVFLVGLSAGFCYLIAGMSCDFDIWYGKEDKNIHREKIEKWRECTNGNVKIEEMAGGHFFVDIEKQCICEMINQKLLEVQ